MYTEEITTETPLVQMTAGQLLAFLMKEGAATPAPTAAKDDSARRFVYGLQGIMNLFNCSNVTAQRYKNGVIAPAVKQCGRKIIVDAEQALTLFNQAKRQ